MRKLIGKFRNCTLTTQIVLCIYVATIYLNVGYLVVYSFEPGIQETTATLITRSVIDWYGLHSIFGEFPQKPSSHADFIVFVMMWPFIIVAFGIINIVFTIGVVVKYLATGGLLKWSGLI